MNFNLKHVLFFTFWIVIFGSNSSIQPEFQNVHDVIIDCNYTFEESINGIDIPKSIIKQLTLIDVEYYSFDCKLHKGQLVVNKKAKKDLIEIFEIIKKTKFPVNKAVPVVYYNWSDDASMNDNNTSCFNYRIVKGFGLLSAHSYGMAIDINPIQNPHIKGKDIQPRIGKYDVKQEGTIVRDSIIVKEFVNRGWQWGGRWRSSKDYQHFEKKN
jgi:peptidoglycan LD-endopeptidase CwlK